MDFDPFHGPHPSPSYALESSSGESDWDEDELPLSARHAIKQQQSRPLKADARVELEGNKDSLTKGGEVIFHVGEAGERVAQGIDSVVVQDTVQVLVDGEQVGSIQLTAGVTLVFLSTALPLASLHPLASFLLSTLEPSTSTVLASYHLPSYIPPSDVTYASPAPVLYLASSTPSAALNELQDTKLVSPFTPPNLLHGLPSLLLMLSSLSPSNSASTLFLLPTTIAPSPLNGPFSPLSPITHSSAQTIYDYGGATNLSDPGALFRELSNGRGPLTAIKEKYGWQWWNPQVQGGTAFDWLERKRKERRREEVGSMYM
ncbi:hypothetical protein JCM11641_003715 [Rhodosporidiobolus odoratus]